MIKNKGGKKMKKIIYVVLLVLLVVFAAMISAQTNTCTLQCVGAKPQVVQCMSSQNSYVGTGGSGMSTEELGEYLTGDKLFFFEHDETFMSYFEKTTILNNQIEMMNNRMDRLEAMIRLNTQDPESINFGAAMIKSIRTGQTVKYKDLECTNGVCIKLV